ncbi:hypothetical protein GY15_20925 [Delftia sp. 670]|nr:hypothetical protein GY15_20925 [Delftia sp. 670]
MRHIELLIMRQRCHQVAVTDDACHLGSMSIYIRTWTPLRIHRHHVLMGDSLLQQRMGSVHTRVEQGDIGACAWLGECASLQQLLHPRGLLTRRKI